MIHNQMKIGGNHIDLQEWYKIDFQILKIYKYYYIITYIINLFIYLSKIWIQFHLLAVCTHLKLKKLRKEKFIILK